MPRRRKMLDNPVARQRVAREIVGDAMRGEDGDPFGELNSLDVKFFRSARVNLQIPVLDPVVARACLIFLAAEIPGLIAEMDRVREKRSKSLLIHGKLQAWSKAFARRVKK
jgi:hypothetical protein